MKTTETTTESTLPNTGAPGSTPSDFSSYLLPRDDGAPEPGQICLANEARFNSAFFSTPLTAYAAGWRDNQQIESILDFIAPPIQTGRRFEFKRADNSEAFLSELDDFRAIGADFKRVEYKGSSAVEKTHNRGLTVRLDLDALEPVPGWRETQVARLLQRLLRNELRRSLKALADAAVAVPKVWDSTAGKDPDADILTELIASADQGGVRPNRVLFGDTAWNKRVLSHRAQTSVSGYASAGLSTDELAGFLGVDGVRISRERFQSSATAKSEIVGAIVLLFHALDGAMIDDPSSAKRFWSAVDGGGKYRVYEQQVSAKHVDLSVEHYSNTVVTSTIGLRKITV